MRARPLLMFPLVFLRLLLRNELIVTALSVVCCALIFLFFYLLLKVLSLFTSPSWYQAKLDLLKAVILFGGVITFSLCLLIGLVSALAETYEQFRNLQGKGDLPVAFRALLMLFFKDAAKYNAELVSGDSSETDSSHK